MIGATLSGSVAVLVALVAQGPVVALLMLGGVILVQQLEAHVLQPFLLGRLVSVHPLGVIVAIALGVLVAGIAGALVAVPLVAALNAVVLHLADEPDPGEPTTWRSGRTPALLRPREPATGDPALASSSGSVRRDRELLGRSRRRPPGRRSRWASGFSLRNSATTSATATSGTRDEEHVVQRRR